MFRWMVRLFLFAGVGLMAVAAWSATRYEPRSGPFVVDRPTRDLGELHLGEHLLEFAVTNSADISQRIIGVEGSCNRNCCFEPVSEVGLVPVGPGETYTLRCLVRVHRPGPFEGPVALFVDEGGPREIRLTVKGTCASPPGTHNHENPAKRR